MWRRLPFNLSKRASNPLITTKTRMGRELSEKKCMQIIFTVIPGIALTILLSFNDATKVIGSHSKFVLSRRCRTCRASVLAIVLQELSGISREESISLRLTRSESERNNSSDTFVLSDLEIPRIFLAAAGRLVKEPRDNVRATRMELGKLQE